MQDGHKHETKYETKHDKGAAQPTGPSYEILDSKNPIPEPVSPPTPPPLPQQPLTGLRSCYYL